MRKSLSALVFFCCFVASAAGAGQAETADSRIPSGSRVFISSMDGFETYLTAAFTSKKVPLTIVSDRDHADFEIVGVSDSQRPGWVRTLVKGDTGTDEQASIAVKNIRTGVVAFGYAVNLKDSFRGKQSAAESCAKHLKDKLEQDAKTLPSKRAVVVATASAPIPNSNTGARSTVRQSITARVQSDSTDEDFISAVKAAFAAHGIDLRMVERDASYDYNIIFTLERTSAGPAAAVVVLDSAGKLIVAAARSGFRSKGAATGAAEEAATKLAAALR